MVWKHSHRDFKGRLGDGTKTVLHLVPGLGTCTLALRALTDDELLAKLPAGVREQFARG